MVGVIYSEFFNGWIVCESRMINQRVVNVPISIPYQVTRNSYLVRFIK